MSGLSVPAVALVDRSDTTRLAPLPFSNFAGISNVGGGRGSGTHCCSDVICRHDNDELLK